MNPRKLIFPILLFLFSGIALLPAFSEPEMPPDEVESTNDWVLQSSDEAFDVMMQVISHKRCVNCHPSGDRPHQGEDSHLHRFEVQRGEEGHGLDALQCNSCHQEENNSFSGVPGAPHWHLAPRSMGWEGLTKVEIAHAMTDPAKNGGRSIQEIEKHLTEDPLVLWVFEPGVNHEGIAREKPPVSKEEYIAAVKKWVESGARIPQQ